MPTGCGLSVVPQTDQFLAVSSPLNVTFTCNASMDELNSAGAIVSWQVGGIRVDTTAVPFVGVFVEEVAPGVLDITVTGAAGVQFEESGLSLACQLTTASIPPSMTSLAPVFVRFFGELPVKRFHHTIEWLATYKFIGNSRMGGGPKRATPLCEEVHTTCSLGGEQSPSLYIHMIISHHIHPCPWSACIYFPEC